MSSHLTFGTFNKEAFDRFQAIVERAERTGLDTAGTVESLAEESFLPSEPWLLDRINQENVAELSVADIAGFYLQSCCELEMFSFKTRTMRDRFASGSTVLKGLLERGPSPEDQDIQRFLGPDSAILSPARATILFAEVALVWPSAERLHPSEARDLELFNHLRQKVSEKFDNVAVAYF